MKVVGQDRIAEQINAEGGGEMLHITFNPNLTMIEIFLPETGSSPIKKQRLAHECREEAEEKFIVAIGFGF